MGGLWFLRTDEHFLSPVSPWDQVYSVNRVTAEILWQNLISTNPTI